MTQSKGKLPRITDYLTQQIELCGRQQKDIAADLGIKSANTITMFKMGRTPVPLARVPALAKALNVDAGYFLRLWFNEYMPELLPFFEKALRIGVTENEMEIIEFIREVSSDTNPMLDENRRTGLRQAFYVPE